MNSKNSQYYRWLYRATLGASAVALATTSLLPRAAANPSLSFVEEPDLKPTFTQLRSISQDNHLPALEHHCNGSCSGHPSRGRGGCGRRR